MARTWLPESQQPTRRNSADLDRLAPSEIKRRLPIPGRAHEGSSARTFLLQDSHRSRTALHGGAGELCGTRPAATRHPSRPPGTYPRAAQRAQRHYLRGIILALPSHIMPIRCVFDSQLTDREGAHSGGYRLSTRTSAVTARGHAGDIRIRRSLCQRWPSAMCAHCAAYVAVPNWPAETGVLHQPPPIVHRGRTAALPRCRWARRTGRPVRLTFIVYAGGLRTPNSLRCCGGVASR
jgi:hypothetical protein